MVSVSSSGSTGSFCVNSGKVDPNQRTYLPIQPAQNFYGNFIPLDPVAKQMVPQTFGQAVQVY